MNKILNYKIMYINFMYLPKLLIFINKKKLIFIIFVIKLSKILETWKKGLYETYIFKLVDILQFSLLE